MKALYRKWRPGRWDEVAGQQHIVQTLRSSVSGGRLGHAYLFAGPRGTGKTSIARMLAKAVNCLDEDLKARPCDKCSHCQAVNDSRFLDLIEIDAASNTSVDDVRDLREKIGFSPNMGQYKVYIIDEVHMLSTAAFNALLKTLEEPPAHAIFVLATTEVHKIPATVLSRCQRHEFRRIPVAEMVGYLKKIVKGESIEIEEEALQLIARQATGSLRDAISLLDQLTASGEAVTLVKSQQVLGTVTSQSVISLVEALVQEDAAKGMEELQTSLDAGSDPRQLARQIVEYLRDLLLVKMGNADQVDATFEIRSRMAAQAEALSAQTLLIFVKVFNQAAVEARTSWQPKLPLEMAFVHSINALTAPVPVPFQPEQVQAQPQTAAPQTQKLPPVPASAPLAVKKQAPKVQLQGSIKREEWEELIGLVNQENNQAAALMRSAKIKDVQGSQLIMGFVSEILVEKIRAEANLGAVQKAAEKVWPQVTAVKCLALGSEGDLPDDIEPTSVVATAVHLGGQITNQSKVD